MQLNFKQKIVLPVLILIVIGMAGSSIISYSKSKKALEDSISNQINGITESTVSMMDTWTEDRFLDTITWSKLEVLQTALKQTFVGKASRKKVSQMFLEWKNSYPYYEDIGLAEPSGKLVATSGSDVVGEIDVSDREYFKKAMNGEVHLSKILKSKASGNSVFFISSPVKGAGGIEGVLFSVVNISAFSSKFIDSIKIGKKGYAYLINPAGLVVAHPDRSKVNTLDIKDLDFGKQILEMKNGMIAAKADGQDIITAFRTSEKLGGIIVVQAQADEVFAPVTAMARFNLIVAIVITLLAAVIVYVIAAKIVKPINEVVLGLKDAAEGEGDLTKRLEVKNRDEVGELAKWFNVFVEKVQVIIRDVAGNAKQLTASSANLSEISMQMKQEAEKTSGRVSSSAASSREVSENMNAVAAAMEEASTNIQMVSSAAEEMSSTINEIAGNSEKGRGIAMGAVKQTELSSQQVGELGKAASEIDKVVETITDISDQVNLLSLNATIEAARAGEAGKGFAVVANEIKELASQTAKATSEIKEKVQGIQSSTGNTITQIDSIRNVVDEVNQIISTIAAAIEEQSITTKDIAQNVSQVSLGINEVNEKVAQTNSVSTQISKEISDISQSTDEISENSSKVSTSASELAKLADTLNTMVGRFKV